MPHKDGKHNKQKVTAEDQLGEGAAKKATKQAEKAKEDRGARHQSLLDQAKKSLDTDDNGRDR